MGCSHKARWRDRRATARSTAYLCKLRCRWWTGSTNHRPPAWTYSAGDHRTLCASRQRPASTRIGSDCWTNRGRARRQEDRLSYGTYQKTNCITEYCCITLNVGRRCYAPAQRQQSLKVLSGFSLQSYDERLDSICNAAVLNAAFPLTFR